MFNIALPQYTPVHRRPYTTIRIQLFYVKVPNLYAGQLYAGLCGILLAMF
jgi:hypothetical protein